MWVSGDYEDGMDAAVGLYADEVVGWVVWTCCYAWYLRVVEAELLAVDDFVSADYLQPVFLVWGWGGGSECKEGGEAKGKGEELHVGGFF